jgi:IS5 family transposase
MLVLQQLFNLSDEELVFQVNDMRSFEEFVGLGVMNTIQYATTMAFFRERLHKAGVIDGLIERFEEHLRSHGLEARGGQIIDATLLPFPSIETQGRRTRPSRMEPFQRSAWTSQASCVRRTLTPAGSRRMG